MFEALAARAAISRRGAGGHGPPWVHGGVLMACSNSIRRKTSPVARSRHQQRVDSVSTACGDQGAAVLVQFEPDEHHQTHVMDERRPSGAASHSGATLLLADRYEVLEELGSGATAITHRGHDHRLNRNVAIKILRAGHALDATYVQRFEREARAAASIAQGNVVDVYDFGEQDGALYIVMQYVDGEDLKRHVTRHGALEPERAREVAVQVLAGLAAIHAAGIIHRDIKPQNVLIGRDGIARVTDFGVAQAAVDVGLTSAGTTVGTAAYMAPEQAQADVLAQTTDIYAVGVVLYEMLTGSMPFSASTPVAMMLAHIEQEPAPPSRRAPERDIPADLDAIVMQAMAKDPLDRFQSARAMSRALVGRAEASAATTVHSSVPAVAPLMDQQHGMTAASTRKPVGETGFAPPNTMALPPQVVLRRARPRSRLRSSATGLLLLLSLALAGMGAYGASEWFGFGGDSPDNRTPGASGIAPSGTPTATPPSQAAGADGAPLPDEPTTTAVPPTATGAPAISPGQADTVEPTATAVPPTEVPPTEVAPTDEPTARPTDVPPTEAPPTDVPPTETAPTDVPPTSVPPTAVPPTDALPTEAPVEQPTIAAAAALPTQSGQGSNLANRASGQSAPNPPTTAPAPGAGTGIGSAGSGSGQPANASQGAGPGPVSGAITIENKDWKGDGAQKASNGDWIVIAPGEEVTARFDVDGARSGGTVKVSIALAAVDVTQAPLSIRINGTERLRITDPLPTIASNADGQELGNLVLTVPSALLQDGRNEITIVNASNAGTDDGGDDDEGDDDDDDAGGNNGSSNGNNRSTSSSGRSGELQPGSIVVGEAIVTINGEP